MDCEESLSEKNQKEIGAKIWEKVILVFLGR
jgi:hypothetical protein